MQFQVEDGTSSFFAACEACGWTGEQHSTQDRAEDDVRVHHSRRNKAQGEG